GQVDDVELHGATGAEPPGGDNVDLVGRWFAGHAKVTLAVATTRDTRLPRVEQLRRGFAGPDAGSPGVVRLAGLLGQHGLINQREDLQLILLSRFVLLAVRKSRSNSCGSVDIEPQRAIPGVQALGKTPDGMRSEEHTSEL